MRLFAADALTADVALTVRSFDDPKYPGIVVATPDGGSQRFVVDAYGDPADDVAAACDVMDVLQETVLDVLASARGRFGPWPACPTAGHTHKLVTAVGPDDGEPWWACRDGGLVVRVGSLVG